MPDNTSLPEIRVLAEIRDVDDGSYFLKIGFRTTTGNQHSLVVPRDMVQSPREIVGRLLNAGALLPTKSLESRALVEAALDRRPKRSVQTTKRSGWHGRVFVCTTETIGANAARLSLAKLPQLDKSTGPKGRDAGWASGLSDACDASSYLSFAVAAGFAGPLLRFLDAPEGVVFNLSGASSTGKTLASRAGQSVFARAGRDDMCTYDITDRALEELCARRNDLMVVLDEQGRASGTPAERSRAAQRIAYMIPGGTGRSRSRAATGVPSLKWRCIGLTSSEVSLTPQDGRNRHDGERLRHIDIPIPSRVENGIFDLLPDDTSAESLADLVEATIKVNYGVALKPFLEFLVREEERIAAELTRCCDHLFMRAGVSSDAWERRFAAKFGLIYAAMQLAKQAGVSPWQNSMLPRVLTVYQAARGMVFRPGDEARKLANRIIELLDDAHFPRIEERDRLPDGWGERSYGLRRTTSAGEMIAIRPTCFEELVGAKSRADPVFRYLVARGVGLPGSGGKNRRQIQIRGLDGRQRFFCLNRDALGTEAAHRLP